MLCRKLGFLYGKKSIFFKTGKIHGMKDGMAIHKS